jgi:hypothetical protein
VYHFFYRTLYLLNFFTTMLIFVIKILVVFGVLHIKILQKIRAIDWYIPHTFTHLNIEDEIMM